MDDFCTNLCTSKCCTSGICKKIEDFYLSRRVCFLCFVNLCTHPIPISTLFRKKSHMLECCWFNFKRKSPETYWPFFSLFDISKTPFAILSFTKKNTISLGPLFWG